MLGIGIVQSSLIAPSTRRLPQGLAADLEIEGVEKKNQLGVFQSHVAGVFWEFGDAKAPSLQALVNHEEAAIGPIEAFYSVVTLGIEHENGAREGIELKAIAHQSHEAIRPLSHVRGLGGEEDTQARGEGQHWVSRMRAVRN